MSDFERLIKLLTAQVRWGLHPIKLAIALLLPVAILWIAHWRIQHLSRPSADGAQTHDDAATSRAVSGD